MDDSSEPCVRFSALVRWMDEDRSRLGQRLHDTVAQNLAVVAMKIGMLDSADPDRREDLLTDCAGLVADCISDLREEIQQLHPPLIDELGLHSALLSYAQLFRRRFGVDLDIVVPDGVPDRFDIDSVDQTVVFRIVQHTALEFAAAGARRIRTELSQSRRTFRACISAHVRSTPIAVTQLSRWVMEERVRHCRGQLRARSAGSEAFVDIAIPIEGGL